MSNHRHGYVKAGPVEIRKADGTTHTEAPYNTAEYYAVVAARNARKINRIKRARQSRTKSPQGGSRRPATE